MPRRRFQGISLGPVAVAVSVVLILIFWQNTEVPSGSKRDEGAFQVLTGAELIEDRGNDGDSFRLMHQGRETVYRLYFVDTCEKSDRFPARLDHQATYFGRGIGRDEVMALGEEAKRMTLDWLGSEPFEVYTRNEPVMDSERIHALIRFTEQGDWLCERLVRNGMARIYTKGTPMPDGTSLQAFTQHLKTLESEAKAAKRGAW